MIRRTEFLNRRRQFLSNIGRMAASALAASVCPVWPRAFAAGRAMLERTVAAMGTTVTIVSYGESRGQLIEATTEAFEELRRLDRLLSVFLPTSDIARLNEAEVGEAVHVEASTMDALAASGRFTSLTSGRFDATVGGLLSALGFHEEQTKADRPVSERQLADAQEGIGWHRIRLDDDGTVRRLHPSTRVDLGGIGAGFAVDRMGGILRNHGVESALIDHSGDLLAIGAPPESDGWLVAIPDPAASDRPLTTLTLCDRAISTSSNLQSVRLVDGKTLGHIVEPLTGENPLRCASVSVLAPSSTEADALSTALFVDADAGGAWRNGQRDAIFVRPEGREHAVETLR
jgi:thiamine biosynthesis lipoprotein